MIVSLLSSAVKFGICEEGRLIVKEYIEYHEFELALEHIVYEINENDLNIDYHFYCEVRKVAGLMGLDEVEYTSRLEKLIKR